tara:strand:- start:209 stop:379 length:171 start_codon:yes stop_codon:yes gene_type:complete
MKKMFLLLIFLLLGCNFNQKDVNLINSDFSDDLTYEEYKKELEEYTNLSDYPNLNE